MRRSKNTGMKPSAKLSILFLAAFALSASARSQTNSQPPTTRSMPAAKPTVATPKPPVPDYDVTVLAQSDVDLYLEIMRAAAAYLKNPSASDRAAIDLMKQAGAGQLSETLTPAQGQMLERAAALTQYDVEVARQRGVEDRYLALRPVIEAVIGTIACPSCGGDPNQNLSGPHTDLAHKQDAVHKADIPLLQPHLEEIQSLEKQVRSSILYTPKPDSE
jgi:hypothetical protein